jgi:hypothetical protein
MRGRQATTWRRRIDVRMDTSLIPLRRANVQRVVSMILNGCRKVIVPRGFDVFAVGSSSTFRERRPRPTAFRSSVTVNDQRSIDQ